MTNYTGIKKWQSEEKTKEYIQCYSTGSETQSMQTGHNIVRAVRADDSQVNSHPGSHDLLEKSRPRVTLRRGHRNRLLLALFLLITCLSAGALPAADLVNAKVRLILKDGSVVVGTIVRQTATHYYVKNAYGRFPVARRRIERHEIRRTNANESDSSEEEEKRSKPGRPLNTALRFGSGYNFVLGSFRDYLSPKWPFLFLEFSLQDRSFDYYVRFEYNYWKGTINEKDSLKQFSFRTGLQWNFFTKNRFGMGTRLSAGAGWLYASLPDDLVTASGWRFNAATALDFHYALDPNWQIALKAGLTLLAENKLLLLSIPLSLEAAYVF